jgi:LacI family transcriptional regulator
MSLSNETGDFDHINNIIAHKTPSPFDKIAKLVNCSKVMINDRKAAYDAVTYLGMQKNCHFRGSYAVTDRFLGIKKR